jgi:aryl-alcohol dehydrogenase-like predicted oxidoreductase
MTITRDQELLIAEALHPYPKDLVIATKGGLTRPGPGQWVPNGRPEYLTRCVENSLKRLQLERIDLYQLHRIYPKVPMEESLGALKKMQEAGKIRHVGLSEVSAEEIDRARKVLPIVSVQNQYNIGNRKWEKTLTYCEKEGLGFMPWSPIGGNRGLKGQCAGSGGEGLSRQRCPTGPRLASSPISRDVADSWHVFGRTSRREHGCRYAEVNGRRLETR